MEKSPTHLIDTYNRRLNYLRISVTDRCNLSCTYCMPPGGVPKLRHADILTYEEILRLAGIALGLGVDKIRVTGGEPLVRKGICAFLSRLTVLPGLKDVSLTTNGVYLKEHLEKIRSSGIKRINVSLDTLKRERFETITGYDGLQAVLEGVKLAETSGFRPVKINVVVIKGVNDDELPDFARLSQQYPYHVRFIEYMPLGLQNEDNHLHHVPNALIKEELGKLGRLRPVPKTALDGPAERFRYEGAPGEIGFISPVTQHFCSQCNRLRLRASGSLRSCLLSQKEVDLKGPMRNGASDHDLMQLFLKVVAEKPRA
ncbi:MAG: GTP 3',8-cyclase MoaA, partial [Deltaproteobacteria bacterium]|nr:GTP 3',8-cyclase MoaA [Deltaproteobacteria bacterium]